MTSDDDIGLHPRHRAQHPSHVLRLRANQCRCCLIPSFRNPATSRHLRSPSVDFILSPQTLRGTLCSVPLACCLVVGYPRLLLFRGFLCGFLCGCFLRGCLLGCLLGCHFAYSPFSMVCIEFCN